MDQTVWIIDETGAHINTRYIVSFAPSKIVGKHVVTDIMGREHHVKSATIESWMKVTKEDFFR